MVGDLALYTCWQPSRQEEDISKVLNTLVSHDVPMDESLVDGGICVHVSKRLDHDKGFELYTTEEKEMVKAALIKGAHGI